MQRRYVSMLLLMALALVSGCGGGEAEEDDDNDNVPGQVLPNDDNQERDDD